MEEGSANIAGISVSARNINWPEIKGEGDFMSFDQLEIIGRELPVEIQPPSDLAIRNDRQSVDGVADFNRELRDEIILDSRESGVSVFDAFFEYMSARLEASGEIETSDRAFFEDSVSGKTIRIDGCGGDPRDSEGVLSVMICDFHDDDDPVTINAADAKRLFGHLANFLVSARKAEYRATLQQGAPGAGLADMIAAAWCAIR